MPQVSARRGERLRIDLQRFSPGCILAAVGAKLVCALRIAHVHVGDHKDRPSNLPSHRLEKLECHTIALPDGQIFVAVYIFEPQDRG